MAFSRTNYDKCSYDLKMNRSTQPGDYRLLDTSVENHNACISYGGPIGSKADVSVSKPDNQLKFDNMVDVESKLSWRRQLLNNCNKDDLTLPYEVKHKSKCSLNLVAEDTRFTHPIDNYRSMDTTPYNYSPHLYVNPQDYYQQDRIGTNTKLFVKDNYIMPKQEMWDKGDALPPQTSNNMTLLPEIPGRIIPTK
jgi:hypothetical protein